MTQLQSQLLQAAPATVAAPSDSRSEVPVAKRCRREDFVPHCDEEMQEWMQARQADLQAAVVTGQLQEVSRISQLLTTAAQEWQELMIQNQRTAPSMLQRGDHTSVCEASHPGPRIRERHRRRVASSSDDEPLVRPIVGCDVIPRTEAGFVVTATGREAGHNRYVALRT